MIHQGGTEGRPSQSTTCALKQENTVRQGCLHLLHLPADAQEHNHLRLCPSPSLQRQLKGVGAPRSFGRLRDLCWWHWLASTCSLTNSIWSDLSRNPVSCRCLQKLPSFIRKDPQVGLLTMTSTLQMSKSTYIWKYPNRCDYVQGGRWDQL